MVISKGGFVLQMFFLSLTLVPDEPPGNIRGSGIEPTVIKVDWSPVPYETINGIGKGYKLALFNTSTYNIRNYTLKASVLTLEITHLDIWTNYSIKMSAFTVVGDGPWSESILQHTDEEGKPQASHHLRFTVEKNAQMALYHPRPDIKTLDPKLSCLALTSGSTGHFRVVFCLCQNESSSSAIYMTMCSAYRFIFM